MNNITIIDVGNIIDSDSNICFFEKDQTDMYQFRIINVHSGLQPIDIPDNIIESYNNILQYINVFSKFYHYEVEKIVEILNSTKYKNTKQEIKTIENNIEDLKETVNEELKKYVIRDQYCGYYTKEYRYGYIYDWETDKNNATQYTRGEASFIIKEIINNCKKDSKYNIIPLPVLFLEPV